MVEVEMKFRLADPNAVRERLLELGAQQENVIDEADHYFNAPDRDFAKTDEAVRLRRSGPANSLTYKGPKRDAATKTRTEVEISLENGPGATKTAEEFLKHLRYQPVAVVRKKRQVFRLNRNRFATEVCLDQVEKLGSFVELEIVTSEERLEEARRTVQSFAAELGLTEFERRSYLEMLLLSEPRTK